MAKIEYDNQGNPIKKPFKIKIAGFTFGKGHIIAVLVFAAIVGLISFATSQSRRKADQEAYEKQMAEIEAALAAQTQPSTDYEYDLHAQIQASLTKQFGVAPEGFEWDYIGQLVPLGNDDDHTCEDVVYIYLRSLSILDFSTAERYSTGSVVIDSYKSYYSSMSDAMTDYYRNFLRKQFKLSLTSIEVTGISDTAVFADGTEYVTIGLKVLDLTDKDFWEKERESLFQTMRVYKETEEDAVKLEQYVYDYIYGKYEDGSISKKDHTIELVVSKQNNSGWLVSGDRELNSRLQYENGVDVARYILNEFSDWYTEQTLKEQLEAMGGGTAGDTASSGIDYSAEEEDGLS